MRSGIPFVLALVIALGGTAAALHQESPGALRLTSGPPHLPSSGRSWDNWIAFASTEDLAGIGAARVPGSQVFLFNVAYYDCAQATTFPTTPCPPVGTPFLVQVTNGVGGPANPSVSGLPSGATDPFDVWVAFDALGTYFGNAGAPAARRQIFLKHVATNATQQVTIAGDGDSVRPSLSSLAGVTVFESTAVLAGFPNPTGVSQVFLHERTTNVMRQLSIGPAPGSVVGQGPSTSPMPNEGGTGIAFESTADLLGGGADTGVPQIFWVDYDRQTHVATLRQLTDGNAPSRNPFVGNAPLVVVFDSEATDLPGAAGPPGRSLYQRTISDPLPPLVQRLTSPTLFGDCSVPGLDPGGTRLAFVCTGDPLQNITSGARLFVFDRDTLVLYQLTGLGTVVGRPVMNVGQWFVTVATSSDLTAAGSCTTQLHVVDYFAGHWAAATLPGQYPGDVVETNACGGNCTVAADCDDGNPCTGTETCGGTGFCAPGTPVVCTDNDVCNGVETCNPGTGTCVPGAPPVCNDGNPCTDDACHPTAGCVAPPNTASCDDGDPCTIGDACGSSVCTGAPLPCPTCERCESASGTCVPGPRPICAAPAGLRATVRLRKGPLPAADRLAWKWRSLAPGAADFGDPLTSTDYALCLFDGADGLVLRSDAPGGASCGAASCWRAKTSAYTYKDPTGTPSGLVKLAVKTAPSGLTKLQAKGKGSALALPPPDDVALPLRSQLHSSDGACWQATFSTARKQDPTQLKATLP